MMVSLLYYERAINTIILPELITIAQQQSLPTINTKDKLHTLLDYLHTPQRTFSYVSNMMLPTSLSIIQKASLQAVSFSNHCHLTLTKSILFILIPLFFATS